MKSKQKINYCPEIVEFMSKYFLFQSQNSGNFLFFIPFLDFVTVVILQSDIAFSSKLQNMERQKCLSNFAGQRLIFMNPHQKHLRQKQMKLQQNYSIPPQMKSLSSHQQPRKRGSSNHHLPLIKKFTPVKEIHKQNTIKLDVSFELLNKFQKPLCKSKDIRPRVYSHKTNKLATYRLRTDSVGSDINKQVRNKSLVEHDNNSNSYDLTIENFNKNIKLNKEYIQREIKKRAQTKGKEVKQNVQNQKIVQKVCKKRRVTSEDDGIFGDIKEIIKNKITNRELREEGQGININHIKQLVKLARMSKNMRRISPQKSISELKRSLQTQVKQSVNRVTLKDQNNYYEWRRVQLSPNSQSPRYRESTFDLEHRRLQQFVLKNQVTLSKYIEYRKQLQNFSRSSKAKTQVY